MTAYTGVRAARAAGILLLAGLVLARGPLEGLMLRHMVVQLPLLVACGACLRVWLPPNSRAAARYDVQGLATFTATTFIAAYWMIPRALEQTLIMPAAEAAKLASLLMAGFALPGALRRAHVVVQLFFVANACAMMAIAGLLYQDLPQRLCNAYLLDDQGATGGALVGLSVALAIAWCGAQWRHVSDPPERIALPA